MIGQSKQQKSLWEQEKTPKGLNRTAKIGYGNLPDVDEPRF